MKRGGSGAKAKKAGGAPSNSGSQGDRFEWQSDKPEPRFDIVSCLLRKDAWAYCFSRDITSAYHTVPLAGCGRGLSDLGEKKKNGST